MPKDVVVLRSSLTQLMGDYAQLLVIKNMLAYDLEQARAEIARLTPVPTEPTEPPK